MRIVCWFDGIFNCTVHIKCAINAIMGHALQMHIFIKSLTFLSYALYILTQESNPELKLVDYFHVQADNPWYLTWNKLICHVSEEYEEDGPARTVYQGR